MTKKDGIVTVTPEELSLVKNNILNAQQLQFLMRPTPKKYQKKRPAKGGGQWTYVSGAYVKKVLNLVFGWNWDFKIVDYKFDLNIKQAFVHGELTCRVGDRVITKHQFGRVDIKFRVEWDRVEQPDGSFKSVKRETDQPLDLGNDLKAATTDALKKCAAELGIAADIYSPEEFNAINVEQAEEPIEERISSLLEELHEALPVEESMNIERILEQKEVQNYEKALTILTNLKAKK